MENWFIPYQVSELPPARQALIFAPHPDDEVFGCGGAAALLEQRGVAIDVVVLTDGAGYFAGEERQAVTRIRKVETNAALAVLGLRPAQFWGIPDRSLVYDEVWNQRVQRALQGVDLVFAPSPTEVHPDHAATGRAVLKAAQSLAEQGSVPPSILFYEVGAPLLPNFLLDITSVWDQKKRAMLCFESQQSVQDYARHIEGLNTFRTYTLEACVTHAEAYHWLPATAVATNASLQLSVTRGWGEDLLTKAEAESERTQAEWVRQRTALEGEIQRIEAEKNTAILDWTRQVVDFEKGAHEQEARYQRDVSILQADVQSLQSTITSLQSTITTLESKIATSQSTIAVLGATIESQQLLLASLQEAHQTVLNSRSWRWTRPLRWLSNWVRASNQRQ